MFLYSTNTLPSPNLFPHRTSQLIPVTYKSMSIIYTQRGTKREYDYRTPPPSHIRNVIHQHFFSSHQLVNSQDTAKTCFSRKANNSGWNINLSYFPKRKTSVCDLIFSQIIIEGPNRERLYSIESPNRLVLALVVVDCSNRECMGRAS